jgi:hypothetical protein
MTDYETVVAKMIAHLEQEVKDHARGEMMSMAEAVHGEVAARAHLQYLKSLIAANVLGET